MIQVYDYKDFNFNGAYMLDSCGAIYSKKTNKFLKYFTDGNRGYHKVINYNSHDVYVHLLVMYYYGLSKPEHLTMSATILMATSRIMI